jgi:hypothetical protein
MTPDQRTEKGKKEEDTRGLQQNKGAFPTFDRT